MPFSEHPEVCAAQAFFHHSQSNFEQTIGHINFEIEIELFDLVSDHCLAIGVESTGLPSHHCGTLEALRGFVEFFHNVRHRLVPRTSNGLPPHGHKTAGGINPIAGRTIQTRALFRGRSTTKQAPYWRALSGVLRPPRLHIFTDRQTGISVEFWPIRPGLVELPFFNPSV